MRFEPMTVIAYNGARATVSPGDYWPLPYRGSGFTIRAHDGQDTVDWRLREFQTSAVSDTEEMVRAVRAVKGTHGSFRITAHGAVITKATRDGRTWRSYYVGRYDGDLDFEGIDLDPANLQPGMLWTGFPFENGEQWTVTESNGQEHLRWKYKGVPLFSTQPYEGLSRRYKNLRGRGGRLYFTETGHIWMNIVIEAAPHRVRDTLTRLWDRQLRQLAADGQNAFLRLLQYRLDEYRVFPVYLGRTSEFDHGEAPWTQFGKHPYDFGSGPSDAADGVEASADLYG